MFMRSNMLLMILPGVISAGCGILLLVAPQRLRRKGRATPKPSWIDTDPFFFEHRLGVGLCLLLVGVFCLYSAFYVWQRIAF